MSDVPIRYIVCPGLLPGPEGSHRRYLSAPELMRLYHVDPDACLILESDQNPDSLTADLTSMIYLLPDELGKYQLPVRGDQ